MALWLPPSASKRQAPNEFREAVGSWARQYGGMGDVVWVAEPINCWAVRLSLKDGDPRLRNPDEGTHFEQTLLHEWVDPRREPDHPKRDKLRRDARNSRMPGYAAIELEELGVEGLIQILDKGSTMSGRGEFQSPMDAFRHVQNRHREDREKVREAALDTARQRVTARRRQALGIPFVGVIANLTTDTTSSGATS